MIKSADHLQRLAADPQACVWVAASAGTGKTKVLTDRVLNLLLEGAQPQRILCLTFTRAAASEMQNRLHQRLSQWVTLSKEELISRLTEFLGYKPSPELLVRARTLFPLVLDSPGGMKIQTIHGFCQSILQRFPLEAKLTPHFQVLDETLSDHLLQKVQNELLRSDAQLRPYLAKLTDIFDDTSFSEMLAHLMGERHKWSWIAQADPERINQEIEGVLKVSLTDSIEHIIESAFQGPGHNRTMLMQAAQWLSQGSESDQTRGHTLKIQLNEPHFETYAALFLTAQGEPRKRLVTKKVLDVYPQILSILWDEAERIQAIQNRIRSLDCAQRTQAIVSLGVAILKRYTQEKQRRGQLDYNDLIEQTAQLLRLPGVAPWVLYKLDGGLDHMLVDEAQDTNMHQWTVISALAEEFFSGKGAREDNRTLFVVGDAKQSIYSFQGANPYVFDGMRQYFTKAIQSTKARWREVQLNISFRSTQAVLAVVDKVFEHLTARDGVAIQEELITHHSFRAGQGGVVEVWPLIAPQEDENMTAWTPPTVVDAQDVAPQVRLASVMAAQIKRWLDTKELLPAKGRAITAGDIMVLVRRRSSFVEDLVRALKKEGVPVAGADRIDLLAHLAVQDLIALGKFTIQPLDDLTLACVLKGPFVGMSEQELFELAHDRRDITLWQRLQGSPAADVLRNLRELAQGSTPFNFYATLLNAKGGRRAMLSRLGYEALDPIEEFLNVVQHYQMNSVPSLLGFLSWVAAGNLEIKRDLDSAEKQEVRIMTVHGSKGLQAPIVFLPDTVQMPRMTDRILWAACGDHEKLPVWSPPSLQGCHITDRLKQTAQQQIDQEYRRLMYVAMTRAEDRLYICGWQTQSESSEQSWYNLMCESVKDIGQAVKFNFSELSKHGWTGVGYRYTCPQLVATNTKEEKIIDVSEIIQPLWVSRLPANEDVSVKPTRPSGVQKVKELYNRGTVIHKLLQYLPDVPDNLRERAGLQLLKTMPQVPEIHRQELVSDVIRILENKSLRELFGSGSKAEVPITCHLDGKSVSGQVDRLVILHDEIIIIDYKTHRIPPANVQEVPTAYLHQLATYKEILQRIYPHHTIRCILLWTQTPDTMEIPQHMLNK